MKRRSIIIFTLLTVIVFSGLAIYGDARELWRSVLVMSPWYWLGALALMVLNIVIRLFRWNYFLKAVGISAPGKTSAIVFLASLSMIMVPGRVGELAKPFFLREKLGTPVRLSAPVVVVERIMDLLAVLLLGVWGLIFVPYGWLIILVVLVGLVASLTFLASSKGVGLLVRLPLIRRWESVLADSNRALQTLFSPKVMTVAVLLGALSWIAPGLGFWLVLQGLGASVSVPMAVSIFSAATLIGSVSMLPGGLVSTESSMLLLLTQVGLGTVTALASVLIIRVCSLWLAIGIGVAALIYLKRHRAVMPEQLAPEWESRFLAGIMRTDANQEPVASP
jgi:uncharacterized protein (TIRG00374 family)